MLNAVPSPYSDPSVENRNFTGSKAWSAVSNHCPVQSLLTTKLHRKRGDPWQVRLKNKSSYNNFLKELTYTVIEEINFINLAQASY